MVQYFRKGTKSGIDTNDLFKADNWDDSAVLGDHLQANWEKQLARTKGTDKKPSLLKAISDTFLCGYMIFGVVMFVQIVGLR